MPGSREWILAFLARNAEYYQPVAIPRGRFSRHTIRRTTGSLYREGILKRAKRAGWPYYRYAVRRRYVEEIVSEEREEEEEPEEEPLLRWAFGVSLFPLHTNTDTGGYFGAIVEAWSRSRALLERKKDALKAVLRRALAEFTRSREYARELVETGSGEGLQEVEEGREDRYEWRIEEESGGAVASGDGDLESV